MAQGAMGARCVSGGHQKGELDQEKVTA
jgi:hypothetical protein